MRGCLLLFLEGKKESSQEQEIQYPSYRTRYHHYGTVIGPSSSYDTVVYCDESPHQVRHCDRLQRTVVASISHLHSYVKLLTPTRVLEIIIISVLVPPLLERVGVMVVGKKNGITTI